MILGTNHGYMSLAGKAFGKKDLTLFSKYFNKQMFTIIIICILLILMLLSSYTLCIFMNQ